MRISIHPREQLEFLRKNWQSVLIIHLSCESSGDRNPGHSPRITSIAVVRATSSSIKSFSIHLHAERHRIDPADIESHFEMLEREMLEEFYEFVLSQSGHYWVHWYMRDINFGFECLAHRYRVLTGRMAPTIEDERRFCLPTLIAAIFGPNFVAHPRMFNLMQANGGIPRNFLSGAEEVAAFNNKQFPEMHQSTITKVYFFRRALRKLIEGTLRTSTSTMRYKLRLFMGNPWIQTLALIALCVTISQGVYAVVHTIEIGMAERAPAAHDGLGQQAQHTRGRPRDLPDTE